jgi:hypothetical protein
MKKQFRLLKWATAIFLSTALCGCIEDVATPEIEKPVETEEGGPYYITVGLSDDAPQTRLSYFESGRSIMTAWESGDIISLNPDPAKTQTVYQFKLSSGAGTEKGVFACSNYGYVYYPSAYFTLYYPGSTIKCEKDYLSISYAGQVQKGDGNLDHLKTYHSIRLPFGDGKKAKAFDVEYISFRGENFEESACMKFNLSNLPSCVPAEITLEYLAPNGQSSSCFYIYNHLDTYYGSTKPKGETTSKLTLKLEDFSETTQIKAFLMMSNHEVNLHKDGKLKVTVKTSDGNRYSCYRPVNTDVTLKGGKLHSITCTEWEVPNPGKYDGMTNTEDGIVVLQEAKYGPGSDLVIMGDGFSEIHFGENGNYDAVMRQAYEDFFSIEPFTSLKDYFNVYYINAVSPDEHDAKPVDLGGATNGTAQTVFGTKFTANSTYISGSRLAVQDYTKQAFRYKGEKGGKPYEYHNDYNITRRMYASVMLVMVNVPAHAGTCTLYFDENEIDPDFTDDFSICFVALNKDMANRKWTTIHEGGGHGYASLHDEYSYQKITGMDTQLWTDLYQCQLSGGFRNVDEYWTENHVATFPEITWDYTTEENVYWAPLLDDKYGYKESEGLGIYEGAMTYSNLFCRPTYNSIMCSQFEADGQYFNAISRWSIWYKTMRKSDAITATSFYDSLDEFIEFDKNLTIVKDQLGAKTRSNENNLLPLAPPVRINSRWAEGDYVSVK